MRTNKASEKTPEKGITIRFKSTTGEWYTGSHNGTHYTFNPEDANGPEVIEVDTHLVESWYRVNTNPSANGGAGVGAGIGEDADAAPKREPRKEPKAYRGEFDLAKPDDNDGDGWAIYNSARIIYGLEPLPVPPGAVVNSLTVD